MIKDYYPSYQMTENCYPPIYAFESEKTKITDSQGVESNQTITILNTFNILLTKYDMSSKILNERMFSSKEMENSDGSIKYHENSKGQKIFVHTDADGKKTEIELRMNRIMDNNSTAQERDLKFTIKDKNNDVVTSEYDIIFKIKKVIERKQKENMGNVYGNIYAFANGATHIILTVTLFAISGAMLPDNGGQMPPTSVKLIHSQVNLNKSLIIGKNAKLTVKNMTIDAKGKSISILGNTQGKLLDKPQHLKNVYQDKFANTSMLLAFQNHLLDRGDALPTDKIFKFFQVDTNNIESYNNKNNGRINITTGSSIKNGVINLINVNKEEIANFNDSEKIHINRYGGTATDLAPVPVVRSYQERTALIKKLPKLSLIWQNLRS